MRAIIAQENLLLTGDERATIERIRAERLAGGVVAPSVASPSENRRALTRKFDHFSFRELQ